MWPKGKTTSFEKVNIGPTGSWLNSEFKEIVYFKCCVNLYTVLIFEGQKDTLDNMDIVYGTVLAKNVNPVWKSWMIFLS